MDCYFHNAVPSVATCRDCARTVCATCRQTDGSCPSCRLAARIDAASASRAPIGGTVGPSNPPPNPGPKAPEPPPHFTAGAQPQPPPQPQPQPQAQSAQHDAFWNRPPALVGEPVETRALVALGYPFWPLAALALISPRRSGWVHRQAMQGLAFNFGSAALWVALFTIGKIPFLGMSAWPLLLVAPAIWLVASVVFAVRAAHGDDVRVPIITDWLDEHDAARSPQGRTA